MSFLSSRQRAILGVSLLGNALEFFDLTLCGVFVPVFGKLFFPAQDSFLTLIQGFFVFAAAFWARPLGAMVFGRIGDKWGRKQALSLSILGMSIPTLLIASLPGYETLGILSPILLLCCRLIQGLCTGGEYNGSAIFAIEHLKERAWLNKWLDLLFLRSGGRERDIMWIYLYPGNHAT